MMNPGIWVLSAVFGTALIGCLGLVLTQRWHGFLSLDHDLHGVQKIHRRPVPRVGGLAVFSALLVGGLGALWINEPLAPQIFVLLLCSLPAFLAGLLEDFTKRVGVRTRLIASFVSAALAFWTLDAQLVKLDTPGLDYLVQFSLVSFTFTCFAVGGMTNAINIIDGLNGLASGSVALMLGGLAAIAWSQGDVLVSTLCLWGIAATIGFLVVNYPFGKIFLGDGGAYLGGFWLAECAVMLLYRNPSVSTWAVLLVTIYPAWEAIYSMYRRQMVAKIKTGAADQSHLHHLLYRLNLQSSHGPARRSWTSHGVVSIQIWTMVATCQVIALIYSTDTMVCIASTLGFSVFYGMLYRQSAKLALVPDTAMPTPGITEMTP